MRGGSEIIDPPPEVLLEGVYHLLVERVMYEFVVNQTGPDMVIIRRQRLPRHLNLPDLPEIHLTLREYQEQFLPVVDSDRIFQLNDMAWRGLWWSRARLLEAPAGNAGGKHRRKRSAHKHHKRSGHNRRKSHKNKSHRCRRH